MKWDSRPKQKQNTTRYAILINKTNRHNSHVPGSMPTSDFDYILRILLSVGFCRKSESLVKFIDQYHDLFFSSTSQAQVEIAISRCFQDRILRRVTRTSGPCCRLPPNPYFFGYVTWSYIITQIKFDMFEISYSWLLDAMVQVPYGNCFSWLKNNSQTLREERTFLQQPW